MNRIYNSWTFILAIPTLGYAFLDSLDENYHLLAKAVLYIQTHFHHELFLTVSILIFLINLRRSVKKWRGIYIINQTKKYLFTAPISGYKKKVVISKNLFEIFSFSLLFIGFTVISKDAYLISIVLLIFIIDMILNTILGLRFKKYRLFIFMFCILKNF